MAHQVPINNARLNLALTDLVESLSPIIIFWLVNLVPLRCDSCHCFVLVINVAAPKEYFEYFGGHRNGIGPPCTACYIRLLHQILPFIYPGAVHVPCV